MRGGLGFRSLTSFNLAMLAKQGWRLLKEPQSLVAKIYKGKYYKHSGVPEATLGRSPSLIWKSIWSAMKVIREGAVWRVGNGKDIKIWAHRWLPTKSTHCVQSPISILQAEAKVCDLIDEVNRCWKVDLVNVVFSKEEAEVVRSIPISQGGLTDKLVWGQTKDGKYSVRSAYHMVQQRMVQTGGESSSQKNKDEVWTRIWELNVPTATKLFIWRAVSDLLPTRKNLWKKKIVEDPLCPICKLNEETVTHVMWSCSAAIDVWGDILSPISKWPTGAHDLV